MSGAHGVLLVLLDELEQALRDEGLWGATPPVAERLASLAPFCVDTLGFEEWLQWVFLPRMREIARRRQQLPQAVLAPMGEQALQPSPRRVLSSLQRIDRHLAGLSLAG
ncbi:YqcC family protein [Halopseudomonas yangmingensis]|mgnify:CR=1 FL=1|uniref:Uncharacterized conserved protein YqcC, DUF446 family n=1 Tax=Halopseudomonas yangmingensis TaxID=1720063 RepID=A0A1I4TQQ5_9GAMM|nr:YqcC family protein [Halopseudomonas yangmingensis]SFM79039.1 Uncharacterized conserved protein YqcC, DUF446 family [Halopseudomonas yangmingensis]